MKTLSSFALWLLSLSAALPGHAAAPPEGASRQAEVATRGAQVMPFSLQATTHVFSKVVDGGVQQVVAKDPDDGAQVRLIREHLQQIAEQFRRGDFSGPAHIHGSAMPGLAELRKARPGDIKIAYQDLPAGGQVRYSTTDKALIAALHAWFDAQLSDHGADAREGHGHHHSGMHQE